MPKQEKLLKPMIQTRQSKQLNGIVLTKQVLFLHARH